MNLPTLNWRTALGIGLLLAALLSSWAALRNRDKGPAKGGQEVGVDYVLHDFQIVALDEQGKESTTLRAPLLERQRGDQTINIATPLFEMPDKDGTQGPVLAILVRHLEQRGGDVDGLVATLAFQQRRAQSGRFLAVLIQRDNLEVVQDVIHADLLAARGRALVAVAQGGPAAQQRRQQQHRLPAQEGCHDQQQHAAAADEMQAPRDRVAVLVQIERVELTEAGESGHGRAPGAVVAAIMRHSRQRRATRPARRYSGGVRGPNMITAMPARHSAAPSRSQRLGRMPSTSHSQNSAVPM